MGDGDCSAIGGNHFIHAARRNIDLTALIFNNSIYGMTGGQMSPTTHLGDKSTTSVYGNVEAAFDLCELAHAAGATYVARGTAWAYRQLVNVIAGGHRPQGLLHGRGDGRLPRVLRALQPHRRPGRVPAACRRSTPCRPASSSEGESRSPRALPRGHPAPHRARRVRGGPRARSATRPRRCPVADVSAASAHVEIRFSGSGGQGILLAAAIIAEAAHGAGQARRADAELRARGPRRRLQGGGHRLRRGDRLPRGRSPRTSACACRRRPTTSTRRTRAAAGCWSTTPASSSPRARPRAGRCGACRSPRRPRAS